QRSPTWTSTRALGPAVDGLRGRRGSRGARQLPRAGPGVDSGRGAVVGRRGCRHRRRTGGGGRRCPRGEIQRLRQGTAPNTFGEFRDDGSVGRWLRDPQVVQGLLFVNTEF